jgi:small-conductance mechanosensitive channel
LALLVLFGCVAFAQGPEANAPKKTGEELLVAEAQALAERLAELEAALETEAEAERLLETARAELTGVESEEARRVAEEAVADAEESLLQAQSDVATANQLYDSSAERYRIARETQELSKSTGEETIEESSDVPLARLLAQKSRLEESQQEAVLAGLRTAALEDELEALVERQERIRQSLAEVDERLRSRLARERRAEIQDRRSDLEEEERELTERIERSRHELLEAKVDQRIKEGEALRVSEDFSERRRQLRVSAALILGALVLLWLCRLAVERFVTEPHRRYQIKKILSLLATLVIGVGLISIFARDLKELVTGVGIFMAGLAIALQEMVSSFFAWFVIRGKRGYRTGDWIRLGDQEGEVVDIGWLVTVLEQVAPLDPDGGGGTQTGGLAFVSNSTIFKGSVVNYTHSVPFLWCSLRYTVTFESDWKRAVALALEVMNAEKEIAQTALVARRKLEHMAAEFAVHMDSTEPRIRTRPGTDGVDLVLRFLAHPRRRRDMLDKINRRILDAVQESENIEFAYRTVRSVRTDAEEDAPASHG